MHKTIFFNLINLFKKAVERWWSHHMYEEIVWISRYKGSIDEEIAHLNYPQTTNIRRILVGNKIVNHSDVAGASPVGASPTISSFSI